MKANSPLLLAVDPGKRVHSSLEPRVRAHASKTAGPLYEAPVSRFKPLVPLRGWASTWDRCNGCGFGCMFEAIAAEQRKFCVVVLLWVHPSLSKCVKRNPIDKILAVLLCYDVARLPVN